eukprot:4658136-Amphidinium_carterae.1
MLCNWARGELDPGYILTLPVRRKWRECDKVAPFALLCAAQLEMRLLAQVNERLFKLAKVQHPQVPTSYGKLKIRKSKKDQKASETSAMLE